MDWENVNMETPIKVSTPYVAIKFQHTRVKT